MQQDQYQTQPAHINQNRHISTIITTPFPPLPNLNLHLITPLPIPLQDTTYGTFLTLSPYPSIE